MFIRPVLTPFNNGYLLLSFSTKLRQIANKLKQHVLSFLHTRTYAYTFAHNFPFAKYNLEAP